LRGFDPARPVFVEAESRKIGSVQVPDALLESMRRGQCLHIDATRAARIEFLLRDYDYFRHAPDWLKARLEMLARLHSGDTIQHWQAYATEARWAELVGELLELHYDPLYCRSQSRNFSGFATTTRLPTDDLSPAAIEHLAAAVRQRRQCK
ncbi:MAG: tRNA 2-selenouridine(34) synthase MnmH, partial [Propionivibrio sp.]